MQDRSYAIAIVVILAICCLGMYVAVSGYINIRSLSIPQQTAVSGAPSTLVVVTINTETPGAPKAVVTLPPAPTSPPVPSPLGAFQTITSSAASSTPRGGPTVAVKATQAPAVTIPIPTPVPTQPAAQPPSSQQCTGYAFCPSGGPPDAQLAPTGDQCPRNYLWGRVVDISGKGLPDIRIRFKGPLGNIDTVTTKGPPDPPGIFNILAPPPGGTWAIWLLDAGGGQASPQITMSAPQAYAGSGNCPTRIDFKAVR